MNFKQNSKTLSKLLALIMAVFMVFGALPVAAFAEAETNDAPPVVLQEELEINGEEKERELKQLSFLKTTAKQFLQTKISSHWKPAEKELKSKLYTQWNLKDSIRLR